MHADSKQANFWSYLSAILLGGLLLNALFGWWWMDPAAGLAMVPIIGKEDSAPRLAATVAGCSSVWRFP
jgi:divalent metal cation (Fe/Co/Zn/Cd) transporter